MFIHFYQPTPIMLDFGLFQIHWYGFFVVCGILLGWFIILHLARAYSLSKYHDFFYNLFFYGLIGAILGARLWHVAVEFNYYFSHPYQIIQTWHGGLASHGAILGGLLFCWFFFRYWHAKNQNIPSQLNQSIFLDIVAPAMALMHIFVRLGNYFNQELYGLPTHLPWGIPIQYAQRINGFENFTYFHPTFLYEFLFFMFVSLFFIFWHKFRLNKAHKPRQTKIFGGSIFCAYLLFYGVERFFIEFLRIDQSNVLFGLRLAQITSLVLVAISLTGWLVIYKKNIKTNTNIF